MVTGDEYLYIFLTHHPAVLKLIKGGMQRLCLELMLTPPTYQLVALSNKLDFANTTSTEFDVIFYPLASKFTLNHLLH